MRCILALLVLGSTVLTAQQGPRQSPFTYRGKPLSYYLAQAQTPALRAGALRAAGNFGSQAAGALPQLVEGLKDPDVEVKTAAAWSISQIAPTTDAQVIKALAGALADANPKVRSLAAVALRQTGPAAAETIPQLIAALNDSIDYVRAPAAEALGAMGPSAREAVTPLAGRLSVMDEQVFVLRSISYALGNIGPEARRALPALEGASKQIRVSYAAKSAILKIKNEPVPNY